MSERYIVEFDKFISGYLYGKFNSDKKQIEVWIEEIVIKKMRELWAEDVANSKDFYYEWMGKT
jgi:hypothetical protein